MIMEPAEAARTNEEAAGEDKAAAEVVVADAERETPEQSHHQQSKLEQFHHQQAEEQRPAVDIDPTGENGTTTGTIVTAVGMTWHNGTHQHRAPNHTGRVGIR